MSSISEKIANMSPEKRELFEMMLMEQGVDLSEILIVPQKRDGNKFPLSFSQQRLWFLDQMEPGSPLYNIPSVIKIKGKVNTEALEKSFNKVIERHEVLRSYFRKDNGEPQQIIMPRLYLTLNLIDLQNVAQADWDKETEARARKEAKQSFLLSKGPLLSTKLLKFSPRDFVLLVTMHHIVSDNWSTGLLVHEIMHCYDAYIKDKEISLPPLTVQYADFSFWQRKWLKGKTLEKQTAYWRRQLDGIPPVLDFPLDYPRPSYQTYNGSFKLFQFEKKVQDKINRLSREQNVTLFMTMLAAFYVLLQRYSGEDDICVGSPIANRNRAETEALIGFFVNTLVLRGDLSGNPTFKELLQRVKEMTLGAQDHQDLPFETLIEDLQPERDMSHSPLFQMMFVMNNAKVEKLQLSDLELTLVELENDSTKFDLILNVTDNEDGLFCKLEYNTDLFKEETMGRFIGHYRNLIYSILRKPDKRISDLHILSKNEAVLLQSWSQPQKWYDEKQTVVQLFELQAAKTPQNTALRFAAQALTYRELNKRANQLARFLQNSGLQSGQIVGVCAGRSAETIVALLAILKAGGVYLPLDPDYPAERLEYMLNDSGARFLLTQKNLSAYIKKHKARVFLLDENKEAFDAEAPENLSQNINLQDTAYIIYTSGSTGNPKGVEITQSVFSNHCCDMRDFYELTEQDNVLQFAALNFDASIEQIIPPLLSGATVVMRDNEIWDSLTFSQKISEYDLTVINPPTAYWAQLAAEWAEKPQLIPENSLRLVIIGGDVLKTETLQNWYKTPLGHLRLLNAYGPTETAITAATFEVPPCFKGERVPIGRPQANRTVHILNKHGNHLPIGVPGELHIGGTALARGYLGRPELTAEKFIRNPFSEQEGARLYKTGDRVRFLPDGNMDFLGRVDFQVKIRGFRIELGEIEAALSLLPEIKENVVVAANDEKGGKHLVAYYVAEEGKQLKQEAAKEALKQSLPEYMIPGLFMKIDKMPLGPAGKLNRRALPKADLSRAELQTEYIAPRTETEEKLAAMVKEILQVERIGVKDSFFDLGGHSMMAMQLVSKVRNEYDVELSLRTLFEQPTVEGIAAAIEQEAHKDDAEVDDLLAEMQGLSDEDVQLLLDETESDQTKDTAGGRDDRPRNALEEYLLRLWEKALQKSGLGIYDDFILLGGDKAKSDIILRQLEIDFESKAPPDAVFQAPQVADFAYLMNEYYHNKIERKFGKIEYSKSTFSGIKNSGLEKEKTDRNDLESIKNIIQPFPLHSLPKEKKNRKAVFVLSPPRSGSTLLRVMMDGHPKLFAPPEMDLLSFVKIRERHSFFEKSGLLMWLDALIRTIMEAFEANESEAQEIYKAYEAQDITTHEFYKRLQFRIGDSLLVDKTPSYALDKNILQRMETEFDQPYYIHLMRHPKAMIHSFIEARLDQHFFKYGHPFSRKQLAELIWTISHQNILDFFKEIPQERIFSLRYEDLVTVPDQILHKLCDTLNIDFDDEMLKPYHGDKMTSGSKPSSQMVGDFKFYMHNKINASAAERWKKHFKKAVLGLSTIELAGSFGYEDLE